VPTPSTYLPGYHARVFSITVPTSSEQIIWTLGQSDYVLVVDSGALRPDDLCAAVNDRPTGPQEPHSVCELHSKYFATTVPPSSPSQPFSHRRRFGPRRAPTGLKWCEMA
jgi:hypothetical protein